MSSRRSVVLLVGAAILLAATWALWPDSPRRPAGPGPADDAPVVFLGNSITHGHRRPSSVAFPSLVGRTLGIRVVNAGISGDTTAGGLARLERDVLAHRPRLVVVELGLNDTFKRHPPAETVANLRTITQRLRATGAAVVLLHTSVPGAPGDGYRRELREIARAEGATLVEDFLLGVVPAHTYDQLHPDERGHAILAERLTPVLREALDRT